MAIYSLIFALFCTCFLQAEETPLPEQILFSVHSGDLPHALDLYKAYKNKLGKNDHDLLQRISLSILDQGFRSTKSEAQLLTIFGAGVSANEQCLYILEEGLHHPNPQMQLVALGMLARYQNDKGEEAITRALGAPHLLIRLEALAHLAENRHAHATHQIEALMCKVDDELLPIFPDYFAVVGDAAATRALKKLLVHPKEKVRISAILTAAEHKRDDLLPQIRRLATHHDLAQQEACAVALGKLHDESLAPRLQEMAKSSAPTLRLAALYALYRLGQKEAGKEIEKMALANNLFAIPLLGKMTDTEESLYALQKSTQLQVRINATLALLEKKDRRCLRTLAEILLPDSRDLYFEKIRSMSRGLSYWKAIPSGRQNYENDPSAYEIALELRESTLVKTAELPQEDFLQVSEALLEHHQFEMIPTLIDLLEQLQTRETIALLKKYQQKAGAPLIRNTCNLALFNLKEPGPYAQNLRNWITSQQAEDLIQFRPYIPISQRDFIENYELTPHETSRLLIKAFESFAKTQEDQGIEVLLQALSEGNPKNRYALAGLLLRASL